MKKLKILSILFTATIILGACNLSTENRDAKVAELNSQQVVKPNEINQKFEIVPNENVCMVNDRFMGIKQIPIEANGITYYGCCQNCVKKIQDNIDDVRYSKDPLSGKKVDKARAVIVQNKEDGAVNYFESEDSAARFMKQ